MIVTLFALAAIVSADVPPPVTPTSGPSQSPVVAPIAANSKIDRFAGRPQARIAFSRDVRNFQVKRDGNDDVLYLETRRDRWFRSEINCFGIEDPRDALGLVTLDHTSGFDNFSRIALVGFGHRTTQCRLNSLVELTPDEAVELRLVRRRAAPASKATSPS